MNIAVGSDHRGFQLKNDLVNLLRITKFPVIWIDVGCFSQERCDYPVFAQSVCSAVLKKQANYGILICGTGIGMSIAANRLPGIYAALVWNSKVARLAKEDDNANILILPSDYLSLGEVQDIINEWLSAEFKKNEYKKRLAMIDSLDKNKRD